uniref:Uncharacterized protein n=2 Tax=Staphylococcus TaxID=1279 RepID=F8WKH3_STAAU|nr:hypothetical protein [Staphylococcus aureus]
MVFTLGKRHDSTKPTFFGYYKNDGFVKKKYLGRIEKVNEDGLGAWTEIQKKWLDLYFNKVEKPGLSALKSVTGNDEWLAEAYMKSDYSNLKQDDFQITVNNYLAHLVQKGDLHESE